MSYVTTIKAIQSKSLKQVYLLHGTEEYFIENIKNALIERLRKDIQDDYSVYDLEELPIEEIITDAETYPFFTEHKLIIAYHPVFLQARPPKLPFEHRIEVLEEYLNNPADYTTLLFIAPYEKIDQRKRIVKAFKKNAQVVACEPIKEYELTKWIDRIAQQLQMTIAPDAYEVFEASVSSNLFLLHSELEKIRIYVGENGHITKQLAEKLVASTANRSALMLVDAVLEKDLQKALEIFQELMKMNEEPIALIALLAFQFRTILRVKLLRGKGYSEQQMQRQLGVHPFVVKLATKREKNLQKETLEMIIKRLADTDAAIKQGLMEKELAFELLLYDLVQ